MFIIIKYRCKALTDKKIRILYSNSSKKLRKAQKSWTTVEINQFRQQNAWRSLNGNFRGFWIKICQSWEDIFKL